MVIVFTRTHKRWKKNKKEKKTLTIGLKITNLEHIKNTNSVTPYEDRNMLMHAAGTGFKIKPGRLNVDSI
jgi:hypothetical protein